MALYNIHVCTLTLHVPLTKARHIMCIALGVYVHTRTYMYAVYNIEQMLQWQSAYENTRVASKTTTASAQKHISKFYAK